MKTWLVFFQVLLQAARIQLLLLARSWPARLTDLLMPSSVALIPVILGRAVAGEQAQFNFAHYTDTTNLAGFFLIGGGTYLLVTRALWGFSSWLRQELKAGTLESLYLTPTPMATILAGVALAFMLYSASFFIGAMVLGAWLFQTLFATQHLVIALAFLAVGLPPLYGLALLYGALVLRLKETNAFIEIIQGLITMLAGVYFPISLFPVALRFASLLLPPTWLTQGLRGSLVGMPYLTAYWWLDLIVLALFCLVGPPAGYLVFIRTERTLRHSSGLGEF